MRALLIVATLVGLALAAGTYLALQYLTVEQYVFVAIVVLVLISSSGKKANRGGGGCSSCGGCGGD